MVILILHPKKPAEENRRIINTFTTTAGSNDSETTVKGKFTRVK